MKRPFSENIMVECLAKSFLKTNNLISPIDEEWWELPEKDKTKQRRHYFAAMSRSRRILNSFIREVMAETTDPEIVRIARRFPIGYRYQIYRHISRSPRAAQLAVTFPLLALLLYHTVSDRKDEAKTTRVREAMAIVEAGKPLRDVAHKLNLPMYLRRIEPGATDCLQTAWEKEKMDHCPTGTRAQRAWLILLEGMARGALQTFVRGNPASEDALVWLAREGTAYGKDWRPARLDLLNILDWIRACKDEDGQLIRRPFSPNMSLATVRELSGEWHYAVAMADHRSNAIFPEPWLPEKTIQGLTFLPIKTPQELFLEGREMHNCLALYVDRVVWQETFIYSVRGGDKCLASLALGRHDNHGCIQQIAGPCNASVSKEVERAARRFVRQPFTMPARPRQPGEDGDMEEMFGLAPAPYVTADLDADIPF